jgi:hypothetical protein
LVQTGGNDSAVNKYDRRHHAANVAFTRLLFDIRQVGQYAPVILCKGWRSVCKVSAMQSDSRECILALPLEAGGFGQRSLVRKWPRSPWPIRASLILLAMGQGSVLASEPKAQSGEIINIMPTPDAIAQNTPGYSEAYPAGVPKTYAWCNGSYKPPENSVPPSNFTAITGWGRIYPKFGAPAYSNPEATITVANAKTYVHHSTTKEWILVQDQAGDQIVGAQFVADFSGNSGIEMKLTELPDGSVAIESPRSGYSDLFWIAKRGTYAAGSVDGAYVQMEMRTSDPNMKLVANVGADWWRDTESEYVRGFTNNRGAGTSNWIELSTQWTTLSFYSGSTAQFQSDPPPPLAEAALVTKRIGAPRVANTLSPCLRGVAPR